MSKQNSISKRSALFIWTAIVAMVVQVNTVPLYYLLFALNQQNIAVSKCERKVPHCNGHCYLKKQLARSGAASEANGASTTDETGAKASVLSAFASVQFLPVESGMLTPESSVSTTGSPHPSEQLLQGVDERPLQPPRLVA